uniref:Uncharacterized protein n=1 Tax=Oryza brachyantha TaxID=4533 RepID=J3LPP4_ORYBR
MVCRGSSPVLYHCILPSKGLHILHGFVKHSWEMQLARGHWKIPLLSEKTHDKYKFCVHHVT